MSRIDIKSLNLQELKNELEIMGEKPFRSGQIYSWLHQKLVDDFDEMSNISVQLREKLKEKFEIKNLEMVQVLTSEIDGTSKFLFNLNDSNVIESVLMKYKHGNSVCLSTQAGCRQGCRFCASTIGGLDRNLSASEMLDQVYKITKISGEKISNIVLMGTGEPLDNYDNVIKFIRAVSDENGLHISQRNITMSTCGLVPEILKLEKEELQITLAISLHAPNDTLRKQIMPVAGKYSIQELIEACRHYFQSTKRRITFEYSLIRGFNDSLENARELVKLIGGLNCHVNLIPVNPIEEREYRQTERKEVEAFRMALEKSGVNATVRREMGRDIKGACGQLRKTHKDEIIKSQGGIL